MYSIEIPSKAIRSIATVSALLIFVVVGGPPRRVVADEVDEGFQLARKYCGRCHGEGSYQGSAKLSIIDPEALVNEKYIVPGRPDESFLWRRILDGEMPPDNQPQPSASERLLLKAWIAAGGRKPPRTARPFRSELQVLTRLRNDLTSLAADVRARTRYFSLTHLHNNTAGVSDFDLRYYRAALSKSLNSLSWQPKLATPRALDPEGTLLAIDLRDLGWDAKSWDALLENYPYGLRFDRASDDKLAKVAGEVRELCGTPLAHIRADWFTVTATRPPLYHSLLGLPNSDRELEQRLGVDVRLNFQNNRLHRAGFAESGVSISNRLVERHSFNGGYYWKSYDFKRSNGTGNLFQFPLGPIFSEHPFPDFAFQHDGGEMIFSLPNGLQAYLLVNAEGQRIDNGPIEVVRDLKETAGTPVVVNGISCMHCHQNGMITFRDSVRSGMAVFGDVRRKSLDLYPSTDDMDRLVRHDQQQFLRALEATIVRWLSDPTGRALQNAESANGNRVSNSAEPVATVTRFYNADVSLEVAAFELGLEDPQVLALAIKINPSLRRLGLGPLLHEQKIDRLVWDNRESAVSAMQQAARELDIATPYVVLSAN